MTPQQIVNEARTWVGTPWRHQGRNAQGIDCVGLPIMVGRAFGLLYYTPVDYPRRPDGSFLRYFRCYLDPVPAAQAQIGDVMVFAESRYPCHCGISTVFRGGAGVIHADAKRGKVVEEPMDSCVQDFGKPLLYFRLPGVTHG